MTALLDYHQKRGEPGIPVVMIEEGNKIYHRLDMAYIVEFPERNNVGKQVYQVGNEMYDHPKPVLRAIKQYRGKKSRSTKSGEETVNGYSRVTSNEKNRNQMVSHGRSFTFRTTRESTEDWVQKFLMIGNLSPDVN